MTDLCKVCGAFLVMPSGPVDAPIGLIGEFPGKQEIAERVPLVGKTGKVARHYFKENGIPVWECRVTNLWGHEPTENEKDRDWQLQQMLKAVRNCKYLFLMGSSVIGYLFDEPVMELSSLNLLTVSTELKKKCKMWFPNATVVVAAPNPAVVFYGTTGEFSLSVRRFAEAIHAK